MRRVCRWAALALAMLIAAAIVYHGISRRPEPGRGSGGSASLGLVLLRSDTGVYVLAVTDQSPAHLAGLEPGDYLIEAGGVALTDVDMFNALLMETEAEALEVLVRRQEQELRVMLPCR